MAKVFVDGSAGTTGLRILERLAVRSDIQLITLADEVRKDPEARRCALNEADIAILCLPDAAAVEAAELVTDPDTVLIDTSTAHRTDPAWTYGFPELTGQREKIKYAKRIANPGCHASGFISLIAPLVEKGLLSADAQLTCFSLTGYSGGGKKMIAEYEDADRSQLLDSPRMYGISQSHKHLPEMVKVCGLTIAPIFMPIVADYYAGMEVVVPVFRSQLNGSADDVRALYAAYYQTGLIRYADSADESGFFAANAYQTLDTMQVTVSGNADRILLTARFDNLGKGASGAAIQNMNIVLGADEFAGLNV